VANVLDPRRLIAGFQGALFLEDGSRWASCTAWNLSASVNTDDVQPLGQFFIMSVPQGATMELSVSEAVIDDNIPRRVLEELAQSRVPAFRFIGERYRNDGTTATTVMDDCVPSGTIPIAGISSGSTATRDLTFRVGRVVNPAGLFV
jgi:hypothetical protein